MNNNKKINDNNLHKVTGGNFKISEIAYFCPWCNKSTYIKDWDGHVNTKASEGGCSKRPDDADRVDFWNIINTAV